MTKDITLEDIIIKKVGNTNYIAVNDLYDIRHFANEKRPEVEEVEARVQKILNQHNDVVFFAYEKEDCIRVWNFEIKDRMEKMPDKKVLDIVVDYNRLMRWQCEAGQSIESLYFELNYEGERI